MIAFFAPFFASRAWSILRPLLPYIAIGLACLAFVLWIKGKDERIADLLATVARQGVDLAVEREARQRDVAALTTLSSGLAKAATDTKRDQTILAESVTDVKAPASPQLAALLAGLRSQDTGSKPASPASRPGR